MAKKLYVGNLGSTTNEQLLALFTPFGKVDTANVVMDQESGTSKGFGFVEMSSDLEADTAIKAMSGKEHEGRPLKVNEAKPRRTEDTPSVAANIAPGATSSN
ncbi:MAG: RNA-binding protein [Planctomycetota bacterium]